MHIFVYLAHRPYFIGHLKIIVLTVYMAIFCRVLQVVIFFALYYFLCNCISYLRKKFFFFSAMDYKMRKLKKERGRGG